MATALKSPESELDRLDISAEAPSSVTNASAGMTVSSIEDILEQSSVDNREQRMGAMNRLLTLCGAESASMIVQYLREGSEEQKHKAAGIAQAFAHDAPSISQLVDAGAVSALIEVMKNGSSGAKIRSTVALGNVVTEQGYAPIVGRAGVTAHLLHVLKCQTPSLEMREAAIGTLYNLSAATECAKIMAEDVIPLMIEQLNSTESSPMIVEDAASLLNNLAKLQHRQLLISFGTVSTLVSVIQREHTELALTRALDCLRLLARFNDSHEAVMESGALPVLTNLIKAPAAVSTVQAVACFVLSNLSGHETNVQRIIDAGAIPPLVQVLTAGTDVGKQHAAATLAKIIISEQNARLVYNAGAMTPLVTLIAAGVEPKIQEQAAEALWNMMFSPYNHRRLIAAGAIPVLLQLIDTGTNDARGSAASAIVAVLSSTPHAVEVMQEGTLPVFLALLSNPSVQLQFASANYFLRLAELTETKTLIDAGVVPLLMELVIRCRISCVQVAAASCLVILWRNAEECKAALRCPNDPGMLSLLSQAEIGRHIYTNATVENFRIINVQDTLRRRGLLDAMTRLLAKTVREKESQDVRRLLRLLQQSAP